MASHWNGIHPGEVVLAIPVPVIGSIKSEIYGAHGRNNEKNDSAELS